MPACTPAALLLASYWANERCLPGLAPLINWPMPVALLLISLADTGSPDALQLCSSHWLVLAALLLSLADRCWQRLLSAAFINWYY